MISNAPEPIRAAPGGGLQPPAWQNAQIVAQFHEWDFTVDLPTWTAPTDGWVSIYGALAPTIETVTLFAFVGVSWTARVFMLESDALWEIWRDNFASPFPVSAGDVIHCNLQGWVIQDADPVFMELVFIPSVGSARIDVEGSFTPLSELVRERKNEAHKKYAEKLKRLLEGEHAE